MFAIICRRRLRVPPKDSIFVCPQIFAPKNADFVKLFSSQEPSSGVRSDDPKQSLTVSYLVSSCGLSSNDALTMSQKVRIKSPEQSDAVLELLRKYGFTEAYITRLVIRWPLFLLARPEKTLLPKLEFFRSIGVPDAVLAQKLSLFPNILRRGLESNLIPSYNYIKSIVKTDKRVVSVFSRAPRAFGSGWCGRISSSVALLRERGVPESSIVPLVAYQPVVLMLGKGKLAACLDRAAEMGFDRSKLIFVVAVQVFADLSESTLKHKMDVYRSCGWSESDIKAAFLRYPIFMKLSEKKIMANMDFLVNNLGFKPVTVARDPALLGISLDKRIKPRCLVAEILKAKGLLKKNNSMCCLLLMSEEKFLKRYIVRYLEDIPQLLEIYKGELSLPEMGLSNGVSSK